MNTEDINIGLIAIKRRKELLELNETMLLPNIHKANKAMTERRTYKKWGFPRPVFLKEYLARQQFYRQNNLPVEINLMIEDKVFEDLYTRECQQDNYKRLVKYFKEKDYYLKELARLENNIKEEKQQAREKEVEELLAKEIKEYQKQQEQYLTAEPLPELPKKQNKIKVLGNKLRTEIKASIRSLPKPFRLILPFFFI